MLLDMLRKGLGGVVGSALALGLVLALFGNTGGIAELVPSERIQAIVASIIDRDPQGATDEAAQLVEGILQAGRDAVAEAGETAAPEGSGDTCETGARFQGRPPASTDTLEALVDLDVHENLNEGHTLERHIGRDDAWLANRLVTYTSLQAASSFPDKETAQAIVAHTLTCRLAEIIAWRDGGKPGDHSFEEVAVRPPGWQLCRGDPASRPVSMVRMVIRRHPDGPYGIVLVTAYPTRGGRPPCPHY